MAGLLAMLVAFAVTVHAASTPAAPTTPATTTRLGQSYHLTATLDVSAGRIRVAERVTLTNRAAHAIDHVNLSVLPRAFGYFALTGEVRAGGQPTTTRWTTRTNLRVALGTWLAPGQTTSIRVPFRLTVGSSGGAFTARTSRDRGVISFGEWFPILSRPHDSYGVGDPQVTRTADQIRLDLTTTTRLPRHTVACPGLTDAPATRGRHWTCVSQMVRDFAFVVNPRFRLTTRTVDGIKLRVYTESVDGRVTATKARSALERLNRRYGAYPWPDLVLAEVGASDGFSMEYPRIIHLTRSKVTDSYVVNHEVAHQWFYALLGNDQMRAPWLDEGFADFTARWLMGIGENQCSSREVDSPVFAWPAGRTSGGDWQSCDGYFHTVFYKGTEFLNAIRARMGRQAFFGALRHYIAGHRYEVITTRGLLDFLEGRTDANLRPLYRAYLDAYD
ncbi:MAG TPA: M1 family aminopeptidase [Candidatus Limnocylindria bacterium]|nr:M1 family aminopeptidase [Candidatus Limnocylindria bacterium]